MNNMEEGNILLADFLGLKVQFFNNDSKAWDFTEIVYTDEAIKIGEHCWLEVDELVFHKDWNHLMLVVEKISKIENFLYPNGMFKYLVSVKIDVNTKCIEIEDFYRRNIGGEGFYIKIYENSLIKNTYQACVEFVKYYNEKILK